MENSLDNVCFRFIYFELSAIKLKPPRGFTGIEFAAFHPVLIAPSHITRDGLALFLSKSSVDGGDEFTTHIDSIDAFTLETDVDTQLFQFTDILEGLQMPENIPGHHQVAIIRMQKSHPLRSCCSLHCLLTGIALEQ